MVYKYLIFINSFWNKIQLQILDNMKTLWNIIQLQILDNMITLWNKIQLQILDNMIDNVIKTRDTFYIC